MGSGRARTATRQLAREVGAAAAALRRAAAELPAAELPSRAGHPHPPDADLRWGSVMAGLANVGLWRRTMVDGRRRTVRVAAALDPGTTARRARRRGHRAGPAGAVPATPSRSERTWRRTMTTAGSGSRRARRSRQRGLRLAAPAPHLAHGAVRDGQGAAAEGAPVRRSVSWEVRADRPDPVELIRRVPPGPAGLADPDPGGADGRLAVRVPARHADRDGRGRGARCRPPASPRSSAATRTWATSASTPRPRASW